MNTSNTFLCDLGVPDKTAAVFGSSAAAGAYVEFLRKQEPRLAGSAPLYTWEHVVRIRALRIDKLKVTVFIVITTRKPLQRSTKAR